MDVFRTVCSQYGVIGARGFASSFLFLERYRNLTALTFQCLAGCLLGVLGINLLFLPVANAVLVFVSILLVIVNLFGWMVRHAVFQQNQMSPFQTVCSSP
jgi:hypothetical protein